MRSYYDTQQQKLLAPFFDEPDYYRGCAYGLPVYMKRNRMKAWCGYVGVPAHHPHVGKSYGDTVPAPNWQSRPVGGQSPISLLCGIVNATETDCPIDLLYDCPGGITWATDHAPGESVDGYWWFGFDCSHYNDLSPQDIIMSFIPDPMYKLSGETKYRDFRFVMAACWKLASQLSDFISSYPERV